MNSPVDLWALFNFLMPGYLSTKANFNSRYLRKIVGGRNPKATEEQTRESETALDQLHKQCLPFIMRRVKTEVLQELPDKIIQDYPCQLTSLQKKM
jgi:TATA-binding protein-associated factor